MRFDWNPNLHTGGAELSAHPEDYDGHPTPEALRLDYSPRFASPGRLAVAAVLAFRPYIAGAVTFPQPVSPELARSIITFLAPVTVFPHPLEFHPRAFPLGTGTFVVETDGTDGTDTADEPAARGLAVSRLRVTSAAQDFGHHLESDLVTVPTNATLLVPVDGEPTERLLPYLAAAVLVAEDFGVGTLQLPATVKGWARSRELAGMLETASLSLGYAG